MAKREIVTTIVSNEPCVLVLAGIRLIPGDDGNKLTQEELDTLKAHKDYKYLAGKGRIVDVGQTGSEAEEATIEKTVDEMSLPELKEKAKELGLELDPTAKKATYLEAVKAAL